MAQQLAFLSAASRQIRAANPSVGSAVRRTSGSMCVGTCGDPLGLHSRKLT